MNCCMLPDEEMQGVDEGPALLRAQAEHQQHAVPRQEDPVRQKLNQGLHDDFIYFCCQYWHFRVQYSF